MLRFWKGELKFIFWYSTSRLLFALARHTLAWQFSLPYKRRRTRRAIHAISDKCFNGGFVALRKGSGLNV